MKSVIGIVMMGGLLWLIHVHPVWLFWACVVIGVPRILLEFLFPNSTWWR
jgi:hypothetical protein